MLISIAPLDSTQRYGNSKPCRFEANLGRLRFLQLGLYFGSNKKGKIRQVF
jgi:hypothetical protein